MVSDAPYGYLSFAVRTDRGRVRPLNEDAVFATPQHGVFGVCDGLGGARGGAEASRIIVQTMEEYFEQPPLPAAMASHAYRVLLAVQAIYEAGRRIRLYAAQHGFDGMASTATFLLFAAAEERRATLLHVGDTLAFRFRANGLKQLFTPHNVEAEAGMEAEQLPPSFRRLLTRAVGIAAHEKMDPTPIDVAPGDVFLIASDGLTNMVPLYHIAELLEEVQTDSVDRVADRLIAEANAAGGRDNISVVVVAVSGEIAAPVGS